MKKIPTVFVREFSGHKITAIKPEFTSKECEEAFLFGTPTLKIDGAACAVFDGKLYKRFDVGKSKHGVPEGMRLIMCEKNPDPVTGHWPAWMECSPAFAADKWFIEAFKNYFEDWKPSCRSMQWTYEAIGPHFQGNPYHLEKDTLHRHGSLKLDGYFQRGEAHREVLDIFGELQNKQYERTFEGVKEFLKDNCCEGIVYWYKGKPVCKIKRSDFGFKWP